MPKYLKIKYFKNLQTISIIVVVDDIDGVFKNPPDTCNSLSILNNKTSIHFDLTAMVFFINNALRFYVFPYLHITKKCKAKKINKNVYIKFKVKIFENKII